MTPTVSLCVTTWYSKVRSADTKAFAAFRKGLADFFQILKSIEVVRLTADDDTCAAVLKIDTIFGMIPFLEYFHVADQKIVSIRVYYDPRPILQGMAQTSA